MYYRSQKSDKYKNQAWLDFYGGWTLPQQILEYKEYKRRHFEEEDIIRFIEDSIDSSYYLFTYIDEYNIRTSMYYGQHFVHDTFIYGYDRECREIKVVSYDNNINFLSYTISYSDFEAAFRGALEITANQSGWDGLYCVLVKCKYDKSYVYKFSIKKFLENLSDYLYSVNTGLKEKPNYQLYLNPDNVYGVSVYDHILEYLNEMAEESKPLFYPLFHTLYEHKLITKERLEYINNNFKISEGFHSFVDKSAILAESFNSVRLLAIKYNKLRKRSLIEKICSIILKEKAAEQKLLENVSYKISSYINNSSFPL